MRHVHRARLESAPLRTATAGGVVAALLWLGVPVPLARGQETRSNEFPTLEKEPGLLEQVRLSLTLASRFVGDADFGSFEARSTQPEARLRVSAPLSETTAVRLMATGLAYLYEFDGPSNLFGSGPSSGQPFDDLYRWDVRLQAAQLLDEDWTLFSKDERWAVLLQGGVGSSWEAGSHMDDGLVGGGSIAAGYRLGDRLEVAVGLSLGNRLLHGGVKVGPLLEFDWRIDDDWKLSSYGLGLQLERRLGERLVLLTRARLESASFRLADRGDELGKGLLGTRQLPVGVGLRWRPFRFLRVSGLVGVVAYQRLRIKDGDDHTVGKATADPAPYGSLRIDLRY